MKGGWRLRLWLRVDRDDEYIVNCLVKLFRHYCYMSFPRIFSKHCPSSIHHRSANMSHFDLLRLAQPSVVLPYFLLQILQALVHVPELLRL
jgi:hypothetical protein